MASSRIVWGCCITAASFFACCGIISPLNSYGRLFTGIQDSLNTTAVQTGWIGSIPWAACYITSPIALIVENFIGYRQTAVIGATVSTICYLLSSYMRSFVGLFFTLGVINGFAIGLFLHSALCVQFKYFSSSGRTRAAGVTGLGCGFGAVFLSVFYEKIIPTHGWRFALRISSLIAGVLAIPASFVVKPNDDHIGPDTEIGVNEGENKTLQSPEDDMDTKYKLEEVTSEVEQSPDSEGDHSMVKHWVEMFSTARSWGVLILILFPAMGWAVFWTSPVSYFESVSVPEEDILLYVTITTNCDLAGRMVLSFAAGFLPISDSNLLLASNLVMVAVSLAIAFLPCKSVFILSSIFIGVGRGWYNILPYKAGVDLLRLEDSSHGLSLVMIGLGAGFAVGTLPIGAIFDATGSYKYGFVLTAALFLFGGIIQIFVQAPVCLRRPKGTSRGGQSFKRIDRDEATDV